MKKKLALFLAIIFIVSAFSACSGSGGPGNQEEQATSPPASAGQPASQEPSAQAGQPAASSSGSQVAIDSPNNRVVVTNISGAASTSNPLGHSNLNDRIWQGNIAETLFYYNGFTGEHEPRIGKTYSVSEDGLAYTIEIYDNVYFHNGDHVTSEAVQSAIEYAKTVAFNALYSGDIERVDIIDDYNFTIVLNKPNAAFMSNLDFIYILNTKVIEEQGDAWGTRVHEAGTGAFVLEHYDPAVEIRLVRYDNYHRADVQIPGITYKVMTDPSATLIAFESGELDFINDLPASNFQGIVDSGLYNTYLGQTPQLIYMPINSSHSDVLGNKLIRQAMAYACNYEAMLIAGLEGMGVCDGKIGLESMVIAAPQGGIKYEYNPEKARELLKEAGFEDGVNVGEIAVISGLYHEKIAQVMQANFEEVGITSTIDPREQVTCIADMYNGNYGVGIMGTYFSMDYDAVGRACRPTNDSAAIVKTKDSTDFDPDRLEELFLLGVSTTDVEERRGYYTEADDMLMDSAIFVPIFHTQLPYAWNDKLYINTSNKSLTYQYTYMWDAYWTE